MSGTADGLAPGFLLAPPPMGDPNFERTIIVMAVHDESGSLGFVINRRANVSLHTLLRELEIAPSQPDRSVLLGGPVSASTGFVLYEQPGKDPPDSGMQLCEGVWLSPSREVLIAAAQGELPGRYELILGYAGWGPGQLQIELDRGSWLHLPMDPTLIFDVALEQRWDEAYLRLGISPLGFVNVSGGAQA